MPDSDKPQTAPSKAIGRARTKIICFVGVGATMFVTLSALATVSLSQITDQATSINRHQAAIEASRVTRASLAAARSSLLSGLAISGNPAALDQPTADLRHAIAKITTLTSAMTWGSDTPAFAATAGGLNQIQWLRLGYSDSLHIYPPTSDQAQLAARAGLYAAGFANNATKAMLAHRLSLVQRSIGQPTAAITNQVQAQQLASTSLQFADQIDQQMLELEQISRSQAQANMASIEQLNLASQRSLWFAALVAALSALAIGYLIAQRLVAKPLTTLLEALAKIRSGDFSQRVNGQGEVMQTLYANFNLMARELEHSQQALASEASTKAQALQKQSQAFDATKKAMMNLLRDAKELEEELKTEKAGVEQKVIERTQELQKEQVRLAASINSLSVGFVMVDNQFQLITLNPVARQILLQGHSKLKADLQFKDIQDQFKQFLDLQDYIRQCMQQQKPLSVRDLLFGEHFLHIDLAPILDSAATEAIGAVILIQDVTEEKVLARSKDEFFSIASHELRTPLTAIRGNTAMIQQYFKDQLKDPNLRDMITDIHSSSVRLIEIVNDFLDASRLEQGKVEFKPEVFDIAEIIESVVYEMAQVSQEKGIYVKTKLDLGKLPPVKADKDRLKQVVYNLIGNAMKFTDKGGITLTAETKGKVLKIFVRDTGRGIPADKQSLLFHKFQQAGNSLLTRDTTRGTGLGLYISKLLIENMGGQINLEESKEGQGTVFSFTLPLAPAKSRTVAVSA